MIDATTVSPLMGIETEYGFTALRTDGRPAADAAGEFFQAVRNRWPHLRDGGGGIFLSNAARFYLDQGKPEFCTPECTDPWEVVRYVRAGEHLLESTAATLIGREAGIADIVLQRCNVDYSGSQTTWGCHESYLYRTAPTALPSQLLPHLVSRIVYTGAGGFNSRAPDTLQFTLSPRVWHLELDISNQSTRGRGIFHTKDEPLAQHGYHRLHLLCGESNCSEMSLWLKVGTTALVVALIDGGVSPGDAVQLASPLAAMRQFAGDPTCRSTVQRASGATASALDIQHHYLECAEAHLGAPFMPEWAPEVCRRWRIVLEQLRGAPQTVATTLDWGIKYALYADHARRRGVAWALVPLWNAVAIELAAAWRRHGLAEPMTSEAVCAAGGPIADEVTRLASMLRDHDLAWEDFKAFLALRHELFEIDTRFGQLNGKSIFAALDRAGVLDHHIDGVEAVDRGVVEPPAGARAALRGRLVGELQPDADRYRCDWTGVWDEKEDRIIDLSDPYATTAEWQNQPRRKGSGIDTPIELTEDEHLLRNLQETEAVQGPESVNVAWACNQLGVCLRELGRAEEAEPYQRRALALDERLREPGHPKIPHRLNNLAVVLVMQGKRDEAKVLLARAWELKRPGHDRTSARILWTRLAVALVERTEPQVFIGQLKSLLALPELLAYGGISTTWNCESIIASLRPGLESTDAELLTRAAAALNSRCHRVALAALRKWGWTPRVSLEVPWPA